MGFFLDYKLFRYIAEKPMNRLFSCFVFSFVSKVFASLSTLLCFVFVVGKFVFLTLLRFCFKGICQVNYFALFCFCGWQIHLFITIALRVPYYLPAAHKKNPAQCFSHFKNKAT